MKAKYVKDCLNEKFKEGSDPVKDMGIGLSERTLNSKSFKILLFIESKGQEGASLKEIQYFIWTVLNGHSHESFYRRSRDYTDWKTSAPRKGQRKTRGYWNTNLLGSGGSHQGLLHKYCVQDAKTHKWILNHMPNPKENMYDWPRRR
jgi:hypothetical protein